MIFLIVDKSCCSDSCIGCDKFLRVNERSNLCNYEFFGEKILPNQNTIVCVMTKLTF